MNGFESFLPTASQNAALVLEQQLAAAGTRCAPARHLYKAAATVSCVAVGIGGHGCLGCIGRLAWADAAFMRELVLSFRSFMGARPGLFFPFYRLTHRSVRARALVLDRHTELVIEGFPRSGNTFAVLAFQLAQQREVAIAHHLHHPAQVLRGARRGVAVVVLIRDPEAAVRSLALRRPDVPLKTLLRQYVDFYSVLDSVRERVVVATFEEVTGDFGAVTARVNARFGTDYGCFEHTPENVDRVFAQIDHINRSLGGSEYDVSRPSAARDNVQPRLLTPEEAGALEDAQAQYLALTSARTGAPV